MASHPWTEQIINQFFANRKSPTRTECDRLALSVTNSSAIRPVDVPGSLSYTVICSQDRSLETKHGNAVVVSFRHPESGLDAKVVELAREIHGHLVPETCCHGIVTGSDPPLAVYAMSLLPGIACLEALSCEPDLDLKEQAKHIRFMKDLAGYSARCWSSPQRTESPTQAEQQEEISRKLQRLLASQSNVVSTSTLSELQSTVPLLYTSGYPQVLTHGDFSKTNILVDPDTYEITGIVDWSLATVQPFGFDLTCLFLMTGCMDLGGWHDLTCRRQLLDESWDEFWTLTIIMDDGGLSREGIRATAETAAKIGVILRYAFERNADGSSSEVPGTSDSMKMMLEAWLRQRMACNDSC